MIGGTDVLGGGRMIESEAFSGIVFGRWAVVGSHAGSTRADWGHPPPRRLMLS